MPLVVLIYDNYHYIYLLEYENNKVRDNSFNLFCRYIDFPEL